MSERRERAGEFLRQNGVTLGVALVLLVLVALGIRWMVRSREAAPQQKKVLTIAISGGPFLGLLGTVVGVMITFASIAAAGDVNVNAIAPGIAAALVATVAGLAVAIPALFGYNWLLTRVKNAGAVLHVFVDELVTKVAEAYSERSILEHRARGPHLAPPGAAAARTAE